MRTTLKQQFNAIKDRRTVIGKLLDLQTGHVNGPDIKRLQKLSVALNDAGSTILAMNLILGNSKKFKRELREVVEGYFRKSDFDPRYTYKDLTDVIVDFLQSKGFKI